MKSEGLYLFLKSSKLVCSLYKKSNSPIDNIVQKVIAVENGRIQKYLRNGKKNVIINI